MEENSPNENLSVNEEEHSEEGDQVEPEYHEDTNIPGRHLIVPMMSTVPKTYVLSQHTRHSP